jgi:hypothetical protein
LTRIGAPACARRGRGALAARALGAVRHGEAEAEQGRMLVARWREKTAEEPDAHMKNSS